MLRSIFTFLFIVFFAMALTAKNNENTVLTIGKEKVSKEEFVRIYKKNNTQLSEHSEIKSPKEYLELFINFKLKVLEAEAKGMDTISSFKNELQGYRNDLAKPYLTDISYNDELVHELYNRKITDVKASHILLSLPQNVTPADTQKVYEQAMQIKKDILDGKTTFEEMAIKYSTDPSVQSNKGDMGYFSAFRMVAPFEDGAYKTKVGEISNPIRTRFGYHLIWVTDKRPSLGEIKVAHIMKQFSSREPSEKEVARLKNEIDSIYQLASSGADFGTLAKQLSDDQRSAANNGEMAWFTTDRIVKPFADAAFKLEDKGAISKPVNSGFGWHIIKKLDWKGPASFDDSKEEIEKRIKSDPARSNYSEQKFLDKLKAEYNFKTNDESINELFNIAISNDSIKKSLFNNVKANPLCSYLDKSTTIGDYLNQNEGDLLPKTLFTIDALDKFMNKTLLDYENSILEDKHPEFRYLYQEYHDGILLFNIMEQEIWNKAIEDSLGLEKFYSSLKTKYQWKKHFDGLIITCDNIDTRDKVDGLIIDGITNEKELLASINTDEETHITIIKGKFEKNDNKVVDYNHFNLEKPDDLDETLTFTHGQMRESGVKELNDAKGLYISDYQEYLEKEWLKSLRKKYKIKVNKKLLKSIEDLSKN